MFSRIQPLGSCLIVLALLLFAGSAAAQDVSPRCEAEMDRAAGHYSKCLLSADASYARHENATKLENRQARCETRFDRRVARAINRHGADVCPSSDLVAAMEDRTVTYAQGAATEASGTPAPSFLFVQTSYDGGNISLSPLSVYLRTASLQTGYFSDRPYRLAGQMPTEEFLALWDEGGIFAEDPPNANWTCKDEHGDVVNYVVELTSPIWEGDGVGTEEVGYYAVYVGGTPLPVSPVRLTFCDADVHLFIDGGGYNPQACYCPGSTLEHLTPCPGNQIQMCP